MAFAAACSTGSLFGIALESKLVSCDASSSGAVCIVSSPGVGSSRQRSAASSRACGAGERFGLSVETLHDSSSGRRGSGLCGSGRKRRVFRVHAASVVRDISDASSSGAVCSVSSPGVGSSRRQSAAARRVCEAEGFGLCLETVGTSSSGRRGIGLCGSRSKQQGFQVHAAATLVTESWVRTDDLLGSAAVAAAVEEAMTLARAAATAARAAAAYAEARALSDTFQEFPSEQDLLLLERARLTEMARQGAVENLSLITGVSRGAENEHVQPILWKEREVSSEQSDAGLSTEWGPCDDAISSKLSESDRVTVRSGRRRERILKRERVLTRPEVAVVAAPSKAKKAQPAHDPSDPVRAYLRDAGRSKLLTTAEEAGLAEGIQDLLRVEGVRADLMEQMGREPSVLEWARAVGTENYSLESRIKLGQACKDKMVTCNLRLVVSVAKKYQGRGMAIQDLIQEGSMGLIRGAEKFDHTRGFKFSTYAHWWIRQAIRRAIADQSRIIRLPVYVYELLSRISKAKSILAAERGRVPKDEEVAELVGMNLDKMKKVLKSARPPKSMEFLIGKHKDLKLGELIPDKAIDSSEEAISKRLLKQDLETLLNTLSSREKHVLRLRYGLEDGRMRTLEEVGNVFRVTRERIRQIEVKALKKLRQPSRNVALRDYLDVRT